MSLQAKWFGFGQDKAYDDGLRAHLQGDEEEAIRSLTECLEHAAEPSLRRLASFYLAESHAAAGKSALKERNWGLARHHLGEALKLQEGFADLHRLMARALQEDDSLREEAMTHLQRSLEINPNYAEARFELGILQYKMGRRQEGMESLKRGVSLERSFDGEHYRLAIEEDAQGRHEDALLNLGKVTFTSAGDAAADAAHGDALVESGDLEGATMAYERALRLQPRYADIRCRYGQALLQMDQLERAADQFRKALEINPNYVEALAQLGIVLKRMGQKDSARDVFKRVLELDPHHVVAKYETTRR